eukprot:CAMPEP_0173290778 /NCGR_PEP_ID=MMETSP1143-20121109/11757_1 /TAXON_ID=483371 /ORGANISM="non described non described, Strain CCMP2298" /LENGTH=211 /DNA_ID=CAMNT_0014229883 /DNA_START=139 /DNA_END=775 /DNA_ORIENTATION=-
MRLIVLEVVCVEIVFFVVRAAVVTLVHVISIIGDRSTLEIEPIPLPLATQALPVCLHLAPWDRGEERGQGQGRGRGHCGLIFPHTCLGTGDTLGAWVGPGGIILAAFAPIACNVGDIDLNTRLCGLAALALARAERETADTVDHWRELSTKRSLRIPQPVHRMLLILGVAVLIPQVDGIDGIAKGCVVLMGGGQERVGRVGQTEIPKLPGF